MCQTLCLETGLPSVNPEFADRGAAIKHWHHKKQRAAVKTPRGVVGSRSLQEEEGAWCHIESCLRHPLDIARRTTRRTNLSTIAYCKFMSYGARKMKIYI
jgi:hypothetical protein